VLLLIHIVLLFVVLTIVEMFIKDYLMDKESKPQETKRLSVLRQKKDKTYEEQLEYIDLNSKYKKYISFSPTSIIKLLILITLLSIFPNWRIKIILVVVLVRIMIIVFKEKENMLFKIFNACLTYALLYMFFILLAEYGFLKIILLAFSISFFYNLVKNRRKKQC